MIFSGLHSASLCIEEHEVLAEEFWLMPKVTKASCPIEALQLSYAESSPQHKSIIDGLLLLAGSWLSNVMGWNEAPSSSLG